MEKLGTAENKAAMCKKLACSDLNIMEMKSIQALLDFCLQVICAMHSVLTEILLRIACRLRLCFECYQLFVI